MQGLWPQVNGSQQPRSHNCVSTVNLAIVWTRSSAIMSYYETCNMKSYKLQNSKTNRQHFVQIIYVMTLTFKNEHTNKIIPNITVSDRVHLVVAESRISLSTSALFYSWHTCKVRCLQAVQLPWNWTNSLQQQQNSHNLSTTQYIHLSLQQHPSCIGRQQTPTD